MPNDEQIRPERDRRAAFPLSMEDVVGEELLVVAADAKVSTKALREQGAPRFWGMAGAWLSHYRYEVLARESDRAGSIDFGRREDLAQVACAEGTWSLQKRRPLGWELIIESEEGERVGWYSGRRWLPGGSIGLVDGPEVALRRSLRRRWNLQVTDTHHPLAEFDDPGRSAAALTIRLSSANSLNVPLVLLTAWAVVMLERRLPGPPGTGGTG